MSSPSTAEQVNPLDCIRYAYGTDVGKRREENQDALGVVENSFLRFFLVADGMGGVKGGAIASNLAVQAVRDVLSTKEQLGEEEICEALGEANARIFEKGMDDPVLAGMGTTFVGLGFTDRKLYIASVGDSRAYRLRRGVIEQLTEDHTLVMELLRSGAISAEQAGNHPVSHMLTRSLGPTPSVEVDCWLCPDGPAAGDVYLLCSDGLYNLVGPEEFLDILESSSMDEAVQELIDLANLRGGTDNITVLLVKVDDRYPVRVEDLPEVEALESEDASLDPMAPMFADQATSQEEPSTEADSNGSGRTPGFVLLEDEVEGADAPPANGEIHSSVRLDQVQERSAEAHAAAAKPAAERDKEQTQSEEQERQPLSAKLERALSPNAMRILTAVAMVGVGYVAGVYLNGAELLGSREGSRRIASAPAPERAEVARIDAVDPGFSPGQSGDAGGATNALFAAMREPVVPSAGGAEGAGLSGTVLYHGLSAEEVRRIGRRKATLRAQITLLRERIESFDRPVSGDAGRILAEASRRADELRGELERVRGEIDVATRKLSVWFGRRKRLQSTDFVNLASEVAVVSNVVREKKESFERATWAYLKEVEVLRYNPSDAEQNRKVNELAFARKERMKELAEELRRAIDSEVSDADRRISELTLRRDALESELEESQRDIEYARVLTAGDTNARQRKKRELTREREVAIAELDELTNLLPDGDEAAVVAAAAEVTRR